MKIVGQNIPPELAPAYKKLVATKLPNAQGIVLAKTTKKALAPAESKIKRSQLQNIEKAVDFLIAYLTKQDGKAPPVGFRAAQISNLKKRIFDLTYWVKCAELDSTTLENEPGFLAFSGFRDYAYPDGINFPSTPFYGAGTESAGIPAYAGEVIDGIFRDKNLRWTRRVFTLKNKITKGTPEPLFLTITGSITAAANIRPSRAMLSVIIKRWIVTASSQRPTTTESPVIEPISALWRYITPRGTAPFFNLINQLKLMYSMRGDKFEETNADLTKIVVLLAPMPMMGKRFNNNTSVNSSISATLEMWQIRKKEITTWDTASAVFVTLDQTKLIATLSYVNASGVRSNNRHTTGKFYWEVKMAGVNKANIGFWNGQGLIQIAGYTNTGIILKQNGQFWNNDIKIMTIPKIPPDSTIGVAIDIDNKIYMFRVNAGQWVIFSNMQIPQGSWSALVNTDSDNGELNQATGRFLQASWQYAPPTGHGPL